MSTWEAPPLSATPSASRDSVLKLGCGLAVLGAVVLLAAAGAGLWWLYQRIEQERLEHYGPPPPFVEMSDEEFQAKVARGYRETKIGVNRMTLRSIERFFHEAGRHLDQEAEAPEVLKLIDGQRVLQEIEGSPNCVKLRREDRDSLEEMPFEYNPFAESRLPPRIVHVELRAGGREAVVWGYATENVPTRWWLVRSEKGWRLFDWEDSETGRRETEEIAIKYCLFYRREAAWEFFVKLATESRAVVDSPYDDQARERMEALDVTALDERVFDDGVVRVAFAYFHRQDYERCLELCDLVKRPRIRPDVERLRSFCFQQLERWEEAAQSAERYERLIGPNPFILAVRARALARLSRRDEAERAWRRLLSVTPDDSEALSQWGRLLPNDRKQELVDHLRGLSQFRQPAQKLVAQLCSMDDERGARTVADWLAQAAPDSKESLEAAADLKNFAEDFSAAGELYLAAHAKATSDEERSSLLNSYLEAMAAAGQVVEAYERAPDKRAVLEILWWDYGDDDVYELTRRQFQAIVAAHKQTDPDDRLLPQIEAALCSEEGRHADAERILSAALKNPPPQPDRVREEALKYALFDALLDQGKWKEALTHRPESRDLASMISGLIYQKRLAEARALLAHLEQTAPGDTSLALCRALVLQADKKFAEAWQALPPPVPVAANGDGPDWRLNNLISELVIEDETLLDRLAERQPESNLWGTLARQLHSAERWETLKKTVDQWRIMRPTDSDAIYWDAIGKSHRKDHAAVTALLSQPLGNAASDFPEYRRTEMDLLLVESLLALGRTDDARAHGQQVLDRRSEAKPLLAALLATGDIAAIEEATDRAQKGGRSWWSLPYHQPRFAPLLTDPRYRRLRERYPPTIEYDYIDESATLLLAEPQSITSAAIESRLHAALPGADFKPLLLAGSPPGIQTFEMRRGSERWLIHFGSEPCLSNDAIAEMDIESPPLRAAVAGHHSWIQVGRAERDDAAAGPSAAALVAAMQPPPGSVVHFASASRLSIWDESLAKRVAAANAADDFADVGELFYLAVHDAEPKGVSRRVWRQFRRAYRQRSPQSQPFRVQIEVALGSGRERLWFAVARLEGDTSSYQPVIAAAESDSRLYPTLKVGELRQIDGYRVLAVEPGSVDEPVAK